MSHQNSYVSPTLTVMVLEGGTSETWLVHEGRAFMIGIGVLMKETPENSLALPAMRRPSTEEQKMALYEPGSHQPQNRPVP